MMKYIVRDLMISDDRIINAVEIRQNRIVDGIKKVVWQILN